ncbi:NUDIX hydrolase [Actinomadura rayongensis]|uniref:NUDIX domain-containing protein n=1 Tax=Actinomadura rayongensis TaxID=1429076 RepID=A0A6I4WF16_9ACTN|nr:NUDIX domain-containing protein [Actinomadura rayongensis]MXQ68351.1 NUDIX domain-containing protein [Actinomadura rayongensis]
MPHRVRAVLLTPAGTLLLMKRLKPGQRPYWVVVGGGVEPNDASPEDALLREIREEVGGSATILRHLHTIDRGDERQDFYLAAIDTWSAADRTGPEFDRPDRGEYLLEEIPATTQALDALHLLPEEFAVTLRNAVEHGELIAER